MNPGAATGGGMGFVASFGVTRATQTTRGRDAKFGILPSEKTYLDLPERGTSHRPPTMFPSENRKRPPARRGAGVALRCGALAAVLLASPGARAADAIAAEPLAP